MGLQRSIGSQARRVASVLPLYDSSSPSQSTAAAWPDDSPAKPRWAPRLSLTGGPTLGGKLRRGPTPQERFWQEACSPCGRVAPRCRAVVRHRRFQAVMLASLLAALFLPDVWVLADRPDNADLDVILTFIFVFFLAEVAMQALGLPNYPGSFFFWMDLLGTGSLLLDISYLHLFLDGVSEGVLVTARFAKMGARASRLGRLVKLLRFVPGLRAECEDKGLVTYISVKLTQIISLRVSLLFLATVVTVPLCSLWTYPREDGSMDSWMVILEGFGTRSPEQLDEQLGEFERFYADMAYYPYRLVLRFAGVAERVWEPSDVAERGAPARRWNVRRLATEHLEAEFNFRGIHRIEALMNAALMLVVMLLMALASCMTTRSVSRIVTTPLRRLLDHMVGAAKKIFRDVSQMADTMEAERKARPPVPPVLARPSVVSLALSECCEVEAEQELLLLEDVMTKLTAVGSYILGAKDGTEELDDEGRRILTFDYRHSERPTLRRADSACMHDQLEFIQSMGLAPELMDSWGFNPLALDKVRCRAACAFFLGPQGHAVRPDPGQLQGFLGAVEASYDSGAAYHSWFHAVDVTHCVYRLLRLFRCSLYLSSLERFALLVSATAHDAGHPGLSNAFLVETSHELALRYHDISPLENYSCCRLFEILASPRNNILATLGRGQFREVRKVCVESILHTDNGLHRGLVKEVEIFHELHPAVQEAHQFHAVEPQEFPSQEALACYQTLEARQMFCRLLLHVCDLSNATKPFHICRLWAQRILDEFFAEGDAELAAGLPVQSLHDRTKAVLEYTQIGFAEFLVAPLALAVARALPPFGPMTERVLENARCWQALWVETSEPRAQEREAVEARLQRLERRFIENG